MAVMATYTMLRLTRSNAVVMFSRNLIQRCRNIHTCNKLANAPAQQILHPSPTQINKEKEVVNPLMYPDYFGVRKLFTIKDLFDARVHLGHTDGTLNSHMQPFIFGSRLGHTVFDLDKTAVLLREALNFTAHVAYRGGIVLFVCHYPQHTLVVENAAKKAEEFSHSREWNSTILTNSEKVYGGVTRLPDLCILLSTLNTLSQEHTAVRDAAKMCIPTIGIVDSNSDPKLITYPVPGNDDSPSAIALYCKLFSDAILLGKSKKKDESISN